MSPMTNSSARKRHENTTPKENPMVTIATPPQVIDDLRAIREEAVSASNVLADIRDLIESNAQRDSDERSEQTATLHVIRDLLDERLPTARPVDPEIAADNLEAFKHEASKPMREHGECCDAPDEALAAAMWDDHSTVPFSDAHVSVRADYIRKARSALKHIADWRAGEVERLLLTSRAKKAEVERDEWKAKFEQTDNLLSRTRDERDKWQREFEQADNLLARVAYERDEARQDVKNARRETEVVKKIELRAHKRYAALRAGIEALTCTGYDHTPDCVKEQKGARAVGETFWHPDCGRCWEDSLHDLLNPTEGETGADA